MNRIYSEHLDWILSIAKGHKRQLFLYFLLEVSAILLTLLFIFYSKKTIDIALDVSIGDLNVTLFLVVLFALLGVIVRTISQKINQQTQIDMTLSFQYSILEKQMLSIWQVIKKWDTGDLLVRINTDCAEIVQMISNTWISFVITSIKIIASFIFLYTMDSMLALVILAITPLFLFVKLYFQKMRALNSQVKQAESEIGTAAQENLRNRVTLRALGILTERLTYFKQKQEKYASLRYKYLNFNLLSQGMMRSALSVGYLIAFGWGIYKLQSSAITFGTMTAFLQLVNQIQTPILTLGSFFPAFVRFGVSSERIKEINVLAQEPLHQHIRYANINSLKLEKVNFSYDKEIIIKDLTTSFQKGEIVAILGASGKGKTTLIRLLLGLVKPNTGAIYIEHDDNLTQLSTAHIDNYSYVPQGNTLLSGSIRDNVVLGQRHISDERIKEALYLSCAEFVYDLSDGLDTKIGEGGLGLSEGQAQRIAIARAILRNRNVWLFDEATSALDQDTINLMLQRIKYLIQDKIVIFVTHDQNVALTCDKKLLIN
ncbi:ABC transporter ATP-binding protein [Sphingobacterium composti Ten et al. 2007 non Yoo et al. 2007]|uniref:ABC transporter ATP-binding protein n=1 Tax=Sphingobacterium composti TaxID=363260 RepID=UPI0013597132|nr:ABC transporter ATP-binding protein [Sphingobacterium composti Ten et al. 2007 non Yoo et al. 2007]